MIGNARPTQATIFSILALLVAIFALYLGTMAYSFAVMAVSILLSAFWLWSGRGLKPFKTVLVLNQVTGIALIALIAYRKIVLPYEDFTLTLSGIALVGNVLVGGPLLALIAIPLLPKLSNGKPLGDWFNTQPLHKQSN